MPNPALMGLGVHVTVDLAGGVRFGPDVEFLAGRLRFLAPGRTTIGPDERPPFGCCLLIWRTLGPEPDPTLFEVTQ